MGEYSGEVAGHVIRVLIAPGEVDRASWNALVHAQGDHGPFMRHETLQALHDSGCASPDTGWAIRLFTLWTPQGQLAAACVLYLKEHSYGEYVFDWAWANAYAQHGLAYYPKALVAVPFTPVPGARLLARDEATRQALLLALRDWCASTGLSSLHLLFCSPPDVTACTNAGLMLRHTVQFHWHNTRPGYTDFDHFLGSLNQEKRKKIRQERRRVRDAGVRFRWSRGADISAADWEFFYRCYERTYLEHGNAPYLNRDFFARVAAELPQSWLLFVAERDEGGAGSRPIAASLIALGDGPEPVAYGRYWGALERVDCLHFEACYYQPLEWCVAHDFVRFEGGAQGEHKMARALMPVRTTSAHWLAHPAFADAVERFLEREGQGVDGYLDDLQRRSPFRQPQP